MIPQKQLFRHDPANGQYGDCHRAAIASILEVPIEMVPHFGHGLGDSNADGKEFNRRIQNYLDTVGLTQIDVAYDGHGSGGLEQVQSVVKHMNPDIYYMLSGVSKNGVGHTVVCLNGKIVHDPSLDDCGIIGPLPDNTCQVEDDAYYWISFIGSAIARSFVAQCRQ